MTLLTKMKILGYKSIQDQEVNIGRLNVLIGGNGSGKSNFISIATLLDEILKKNLGIYSAQCGIESLLYGGKKNSDHISMEFTFDNEYSYGFELVPTADDCLVFSREFWKQGADYISDVEEIHTESALEHCGSASYVLSALRKNRLQVYHFNAVSAVKQGCRMSDYAFLKNDAGNLAAFLWQLRQCFPDGYRRIVDHIQLIAPYFGDFYLEPQGDGGEWISLRWTDRNRDTVLNADHLSAGTLRFICLAALLLQPVELRPAVVVIDEPEIGLHSYAVHVLAEMLRQASLESQIFLAAQSADLLDYFEPEDVLIVNRNRNSNVTEFSRLKESDLKNWLEDYSLGELWRKNIIEGRLAH